MTADLSILLSDVEHVILDFDGPLCSVFAGEPAPQVAQRLREYAADHVQLSSKLRTTDDPLDFARAASVDNTPFGDQLAVQTRDAEVAAVTTARPTAGAVSVIMAAKRTERALSIVSNNAREAVEAYLVEHNFTKHFETVEARTAANAHRMKPNPFLLDQAITAYAERHRVTATEAKRISIFVGDSITDVQGAQAAGIPCIAYANEPGKRRRFDESHAVAVITHMEQLAEALNGRWDAQWCAHQGCG